MELESGKTYQLLHGRGTSTHFTSALCEHEFSAMFWFGSSACKISKYSIRQVGTHLMFQKTSAPVDPV